MAGGLDDYDICDADDDCDSNDDCGDDSDSCDEDSTTGDPDPHSHERLARRGRTGATPKAAGDDAEKKKGTASSADNA